MGLFDNICKQAADKLENMGKKFIESQQKKLQHSHSTVQSKPQDSFQNPPYDPFQDPVIKQYFEIACGMHGSLTFQTGLAAFASTEYPMFKQYAEHFLNEPYDEEKLKRALELYHASLGEYVTPEDQKYDKLARELRETTATRDWQGYTGPYAMDRYTVCRMFFQDEIAAAAESYEKVLDVIKNNINYRHFAEGVHKIACNDTAKQIVIADSLCAGNPITQKVVFEYINNSLEARSSDHNSNLESEDYYEMSRKFPQDVSLLALRAAHFNKYGSDKENYAPLTDEELKDFVLNEEYYKNRIEDHPFDIDSWIRHYTNRIKDACIFSHKGNYGVPFEINYVDEYSCDAACNAVWKEIAGRKQDSKDLCESTDPITILHIVLKHLHATMG